MRSILPPPSTSAAFSLTQSSPSSPACTLLPFHGALPTFIHLSTYISRCNAIDNMPTALLCRVTRLATVNCLPSSFLPSPSSDASSDASRTPAQASSCSNLPLSSGLSKLPKTMHVDAAIVPPSPILLLHSTPKNGGFPHPTYVCQSTRRNGGLPAPIVEQSYLPPTSLPSATPTTAMSSHHCAPFPLLSSPP